MKMAVKSLLIIASLTSFNIDAISTQFQEYANLSTNISNLQFNETSQTPESIGLDRRKRYKRSFSSRILITQHFTERTVTPGGDVSMQCSATSTRAPQFVWERDGVLISSTTDARYAIGQIMMADNSVTAQLNISRVRVEDGGLYACIAKEGEFVASHENRLDVYGPPYIRALPPIKVRSGEAINLRCPFYGYPISKIDWEYQGKILNTHPYSRYKRDAQISNHNGVLSIPETTKEQNNAVFTCVVTSPSGEMARRAFEVQVIEAPVLEELLLGTNLQEGQIANIYCNVRSGDQPIHFEWLKDGKRIPSNLKIVERNSEIFSALIIKKVSLEHCGTYTCVASNHVAKVNRSTELFIKVAPKWQEEPMNSSLLLGRRGMITCSAAGYPQPQVHWIKKDSDLGTWQPILELAGGGIQSLSNGTLMIEEVSLSDEGLYSCNVENGVGQPLSKTVWISVNRPAYFETPSQNKTVRSGHAVTLQCNAMGDDPVRISWFHNDVVLDRHQSRFKVTESRTAGDKSGGVNSTITIHHAETEDAGDYGCRANNPYGSSVFHVYLDILEPPTPPMDLRLESAESRKAAISWRDTLRVHVQFYSVQYAPRVYPIWDQAMVVNITRKENELRQSMELTNLQPATTYNVRVASGNQVDISPYTPTLQFDTLEEAPLAPPTKIQVEQSHNPGELRLTWYPPAPDTHQGTLLGYRIKAEPQNAVSHDEAYTKTVKITKLFGQQETILSGLKKNTRYAVSLAAFTLAGTGPFSIPMYQDTREGAPEQAPSSVECTAVSSTSLRIGWQPITSGEGHSLAGYTILYTTEDGSWQNSTSLHTEVYLQGLAKYTNYTVKVAGFSTYGPGPDSFPILCATLEDVPGPPADIKVLVASLSSLLVSWKRPDQPNGMLLSYNVYVKPTSSSNLPQAYRVDAETQTVSSKSLTLEVQDLRQGRQYELWVTARSGAGEGPATRRVTAAPSNRVVAGVASLGGTLTVGVGSSLLLVCQCVGVPQPRTVWYHKQNIITHHPRFTRNHDDSLLINNIDPSLSGNYTCLAKNLYGSDSVEYTVVVLSVPTPPSIRARADAASVKLSWDLPHDSHNVLSYNLSWKESEVPWQDASSSTQVSTQAGIQSHTLTGLKCGTKYSVRITATNKVGTSQPAYLDFSTLGGVPIPPSSTEWLWSNATQIHISQAGWDDNGCEVSRWLVYYRARGQHSWLQAYSDYDSTLASPPNAWQPHYGLGSRQPLGFVIGNLPPATWFQIKVAAKNEAGISTSVYSYATKTVDGAEIATPTDLFDINMIVIVCSSILLTCCLIACVYILLRRQRLGDLPDYRNSIAADNKSSSGNLTANTSHTNLAAAVKENPNRIYSAPLRNTNKHELYEISPYAQFQVGFRTFGHVENQDLPTRHPRHKKYDSETSFQACSESEDSDSISKSTLKSAPRKICRTPHHR